MKSKKQIIVLAVLWMSCITVNSFAQTPSAAVDKWYNSKAWLHGVKRTPTGPINKAELAKQYKAHQDRWDLAFKFLKETKLDTLKPGKYPLDGDNVYINVTEVTSKDKDSVMFEAHKNYADIHCVISGQELIGIAPYATAVLKKEYDPAKDIAFYKAKGQYFVSNPSTIFIMFPEKDAHCGGIKVKQPGVVKKLVVKVKTSS